MSDKQAKKIRQQYRRDMRGYVNEIVTQFKQDIVGNNPIKQKPRFLPRKIWRMVVLRVINQEFFDKWYGKS